MTRLAKHIAFATLLDLADKKLAADERVSSHLSECASCGDELHRLESLVSLMKDDKSVDAPRDVFAYAVNIFRQQAGTREPSLVQRIVAAVSFDSLNRAPAFGVRSGQTTSRQLLYSAGETDLDLHINEQDHDRWVVAGQVLGENCSGGQIQLKGDAGSASALLNEQCEFTLPAVAPGNYDLLLRLANVEVEVQRLKIGG